MNLSPRWVEALEHAGIEARHWSTVGDGAASDRDVFQWAAALLGGGVAARRDALPRDVGHRRQVRLRGVEVRARVLVCAEVRDQQGRCPPATDELDALAPDLDVDVGRQRGRQHEELMAGPDAGDVSPPAGSTRESCRAGAHLR